MSEQVSQPSDDPETSTRVSREVWLVYAVSVVLTAGVVALGRVVPWIGANSLGLVAFIFLYLPIAILRRSRREPGDYGLTLTGARRGVAVGLLLAAMTFAPFVVGFHMWETVVFDHELDLDAANYEAWPDGMRREPVAPGRGFALWRSHRNLRLRWEGNGPWSIVITSDAELVHRGGALPDERLSSDADNSWVFQTPDGAHHVAFWARGGSTLEIEVSEDGAVPSIVAPGADVEGGHIKIERSLWWIALALLTQIVLIALPEEFFYRGYLQGRLNQAYPTRYRLGAFHLSKPILITSLMFALGHFVIGFDPRRLSVFFPSLLFGWMRDRWGGLAAPIVYHALCNLMVELVVVHYWPAG